MWGENVKKRAAPIMDVALCNINKSDCVQINAALQAACLVRHLRLGT